MVLLKLDYLSQTARNYMAYYQRLLYDIS